MPPDWIVPDAYLEWLERLEVQDEPETCMAYSLANACRMAGHAIRAQRILEEWVARGLCIPGSAPVTLPRRALERIKPMLAEAGLEAGMHVNFSSSDFAKTFPMEATTHSSPAHVITLGPGYMEKYHDTLGDRTPKRARRKAFIGPGHDVLVLGMEGTNVLVHDPDPQLKPAEVDGRFGDHPVVRLDRAQARTYFGMGDHARTLTSVSKQLIRAKPTPGKRRPGQAALTEEL